MTDQIHRSPTDEGAWLLWLENQEDRRDDG